MILGSAVQGSGKDPGHSSLPDSAVTAEDVAVSGASLLNGVLQGTGDVLLSDHLGKLLRTVFAGQDGITHEGEETIIRDPRESCARIEGAPAQGRVCCSTDHKVKIFWRKS